MNHAFYLNKMPQELRAAIEAEPVYAAWLKQGRTLLSIWNDPAIMEAIYNQMSAREKNVLRILVTALGCEPFDWTKFEKHTSPLMSGAEAKAGFIPLLRKGLVYMFRKSWGEHVFALAQDGLAVWQTVLFGGHLPQSEPSDLSVIEVCEESGSTLAAELFHTLVFIRSNELKLTKNGTLYKKQLQKWEELLTLQDGPFQALGLKYSYADVYPLKLAVIFELLYRLRLVERRVDRLCLCEAAVHCWLALSEQEQNRRLYAVWKPVVFPDAAWLQHAALLLERQPQGVWIRISDLLQCLRSDGLIAANKGAADAELTGQLEQQWINPLTAFGWIEKGRAAADGGGELLYRWCTHPFADETENAADAHFYVQPDFEVLVPPDVPFAVRWELSAFAGQIKSDPMSVYKLTKENLLLGLETGVQLEAILQLLENHAMYGIPDHVRLALGQWAGTFGKVQLARGILLRCEDEHVADTILAFPGVEACLAERLGGRTWIIRAERLKILNGLLEKAGWLPGKLVILDDGGPIHGNYGMESEEQKSVSTAADKPEHFAHDEKGVLLPTGDKGFFYSKHSLAYFEMELKIPGVLDLYPGLNGVPQSWLKEYRTYHVSTRREIVEQAMDWKTSLQVRHNGLNLVIAPRKLLEMSGTWSMTGLEQSGLREISLNSDDLQELKIILPGIYENIDATNGRKLWYDKLV